MKPAKTKPARIEMTQDGQPIATLDLPPKWVRRLRAYARVNDVDLSRMLLSVIHFGISYEWEPEHDANFFIPQTPRGRREDAKFNLVKARLNALEKKAA